MRWGFVSFVGRVRQGEYDVALEAVTQNGLALHFAWGHLKANEYIAEKAMEQVGSTPCGGAAH